MEVYMVGREKMTGGRRGSIESTHDKDTTSNSDVPSSFFPFPHQNSALRGPHAVVWTKHGTAYYTWGQNEEGQCGREFSPHFSIPVPMAVPKTAQQQPRPVSPSTSLSSLLLLTLLPIGIDGQQQQQQ
mmetsp:Transcript_58229/g.62911  ORF Transcript_58229/g.62911 Transcript_58229/m.62911 type:complete len:128 (+) Transcript_58229:1454-1837(+)